MVAVGGATVDLFLLIDPSNPHIKFDSESDELMIRLGDKVVLDNSKLAVGGNANNVSVGLKRLGFKTALMAEIGNDEFSDEILENLEKEKVDGSLVLRGDTYASFSVILNYHKDRTIFTRKAVKKHDFDFSGISAPWVYLSSIGDVWEVAYKKTGEFVRKSNAKLAFNPGPEQLDKGLDSFSYLLPLCEILIVNREEAQRMIKDEGLMMKDLLFELKKLGPKIVVVTDGKNGSFAINEKGEIFEQEAIKVRIVSATGAGDAYSSGFLGAIMSGKPIKEAMEWGTKNAASVVKLIGGQTGLLKKEEI